MSAPSPLPLVLIAAVARNGVIGTREAMPWRLASDMRHFKAATMGRPVLMGRKTFQSIPGGLPGRPVIVVSRDPAFQAPGAHRAGSIAEALILGEAIGRQHGATSIMVAGGGEIYAALIGRAARLLITEVALSPDGDTRFPAIDPALWREASRLEPAPTARDEAPFAFVTFERR